MKLKIILLLTVIINHHHVTSEVINSHPEMSFVVSPMFSWYTDPDNSTIPDTSSASKKISWTVTEKDITTRFNLKYVITREASPSQQSGSVPGVNIESSFEKGQPIGNRCGGRNTGTKQVEIIAPEINIPLQIPRKVTSGMSIRIQGQPNAAGTFDINLINGTSATLDDNQVLLHIRANRLQPATGLAVHLNSRVKGNWGPREGPQQKKLFTSHQFFEILITPTPEHFRIFINGLHFIDYKYRGGGPAGISHVLFRPGATYYRVRFEDSVEFNRDQFKLLEMLVQNMPKPN